MAITNFINLSIDRLLKSMNQTDLEALTNFLYGGYRSLTQPCASAYDAYTSKIITLVTASFPDLPVNIRQGIEDDILFGILDVIESEWI